jgi:hypothetical protein
MSTANKFRFVSPGIMVDEIDRSQIPRLPDAVGPVVIGRTQRGPGLLPTKVNNWSEYVQLFGTPLRGAGTGDIWRDGNTTSPTYAMYAAQAYLRNSGPLTVVRLLGAQSDDPTVTGFEQAGWTTTNPAADTTVAANGGAYGLFIVPSASSYASDITGALAAVFYLDEGAVRLVGNDFGGNDVGTNGAANFVANIGSNFEFQAVIEDSSGNTELNTTFNFNPNSSKYIRKVFNTNPTLTNSDVTPAESLKTYWLGETFESHLKNVVDENSGSAAGSCFAALVALENNTVSHADFQGVEAQAAKTGWVFSQHLGTSTGSYDAQNMTKLFRFVVNKGDGSGEYEQNNVKISILDIKASTNTYYRYGSFTVAVRKASDTDAAPEFLEVFANVNLDPNSPDYIANRIGDQYVSWDSTEKRHRTLGSYASKSNYIRVEVNQVIEAGGIDPELLPFGFYGPPRFKSTLLVSGSAVTATNSHTPLMVGTGSVPYAPAGGGGTVAVVGGPTVFSASLVFPSLSLRLSSSDAGVLDDSDAYFGVVTQKVGASKFDEDYRDLVRAKPDGVDSYVADANTEYSFIFTLDDVVGASGSTVQSYWLSGSRQAGRSVTALAAGATGSTDGYNAIIERGHDRFTMPLFGGSDGLDITERDPFRNSYLSKGAGSERGNYAVYTLRRAIDSMRDPETVECNLVAMPGITNSGVTNHLINTVEDRADALAIVDVEGGYVPTHESNSDESLRLGSVTSTVNSLKARALNTSYACTYYPWVKINDPESGFPLWVPPSVVALGTMASSDKKSEVWFAPAGFNRGGLSEGSSGLQVVDVREKLSSKQRDALYEVNINPIGSFPNEGIVIYGQKTLQVTQSALDRINVRRLMLHVRKEISRIAARLLFDQNVTTTWERFKGQVDPFLESIKSRFGLTDFRVILDETTTTADLIDRNTMYAKIYLKPARSIEFIALDFIITNTGASFEDL